MTWLLNIFNPKGETVSSTRVYMFEKRTPWEGQVSLKMVNCSSLSLYQTKQEKCIGNSASARSANSWPPAGLKEGAPLAKKVDEGGHFWG